MENKILIKGLYRIGVCGYCGNRNKVLRPSPFMADIKTMMCEYCWNETKKEYLASHGEHIPDFNENKVEYEEINKAKVNEKNIQELINYLEAVKKESGANTKVLIDGELVYDFEDVISVDHVKDEIDFLTNGYVY